MNAIWNSMNVMNGFRHFAAVQRAERREKVRSEFDDFIWMSNKSWKTLADFNHVRVNKLIWRHGARDIRESSIMHNEAFEANLFI